MCREGGDVVLCCQTVLIGEHRDNAEALAGRHACIFAAV